MAITNHERAGKARMITEQARASLWEPTPVPPALLHAARDLRARMTNAEHALWRCLRGKQLGGYRFRRQHPIAQYVLDFYCPAARLAVEVDGGQHGTAVGLERDAARTAFLAQQGIRVLRFWNSDVNADLEGVLIRIWEGLQEAVAPPPQPSPAGGGSTAAAGGGSTAAAGGGSTAAARAESRVPIRHGGDRRLLPPAGGGREGGTRRVTPTPLTEHPTEGR